MPDSTPRELLPAEPLAVSIRDACRYSNLGETSIRKLIDQGKLETTKVFDRRLVNFQSLKRVVLGEAAL